MFRPDSTPPHPAICPQAPEEQFAAFSESLLPGDVLVPNSRTLIKSAKTGMFCRVVDVQGTGQIKCDVSDPAQATRFVYTGSGFSYNGGCLPVRLRHYRRCLITSGCTSAPAELWLGC